ncbi:MAG: penicillin-binding protein 2 [Leptolyngbya sp. PLA1]|nr:penicillin-binding protein 2 [Leptolyngbya sp. PLA1]
MDPHAPDRADVLASEPASPLPAPRTGVIATLLLSGVVVTAVVLVARVAQLQLRPSAQLAEHISPRVAVRTQPSLRGDLLDRNNRVLAATRYGARLVIDPTLLREEGLDVAIGDLARALGESPDTIGTRIREAQATNARRAAGQPEPVRTTSLKIAEPGEQGEPAEQPGGAVPPKGPIRYLRLGGVLTAAQADDVRAVLRTHKVRGATIEKLPIRDPAAGPEAAALVGKVGHYDDGKIALDNVGVLGAERLLEGVLAGDPGSVRYVRDARGRPLWMDPGSVRPPTPGEDFHLSIDLELQRLCHEELTKGVLDQNAQGGRLVMIDPATGELLAMVDIVRAVDDAVPFPWADKPPPRKKGEPAPKVASMPEGKPRRYIIIPEDKNRATHPALARNRCIEDMYEPGSTFKPFVWSTINELGLIRLDEVIDTEGGRWRLPIGRYLEDVVKRDRQTWYDVLVNSSNIGMVKGAGRLTPQQLHDACIRFGFGKPTGLGLPGRPIAGESAGAVTPLSKWSRFTHTSVPYGHEIGVTPVQMARAFAVFAREGELAGTLPRLRLDAVSSGDPEGVIYRVLPPDIALGVREPLAKVAAKMEETMKTGLKQPVPEGGWRYRIFGKSGTADVPLGPAPEGKVRPRGSTGYYDDHFNSSFIAAGPMERPRLVVCVVIDDPRRPGDRRLRYGAAAAGPVARRVLERSLTYLGVAPSPPAEPALAADTPR